MMCRRPLLACLVVLALCGLSCCNAQDVESTNVCDCTEECTNMAKAVAVETETTCKERVESVETLAARQREQDASEIAALQQAIEDAKKNSQASLERANSLRREHEDALNRFTEQVEHDKALCKDAQDEVVSLRAQVEKMTLAQSQEEGWKRQAMFLTKETQRLELEKESLTKELKDTKQNLEDTNDKYLASSRELLQTKEEYRRLYKEYSTTHVNFKLMRDDIMATLQTASNKIEGFWNKRLAPYWNKVVTVLSPWIQSFVSTVGPIVQSMIAWMVDLFYQHVLPFWKNTLYPKLEPTLEPLIVKHNQALASISAVVQKQSHALYSYIKLLEGRQDCKIRNALLEVLQFGDNHSDRVVRILEQVLVLFVGFWLIAGCMALKRHCKRRAKHVQPQPASGGIPLAYANHSRKKNQ